MAATRSDTLGVGDKDPDFTRPSPDGEPVTRSVDQGGSPLLLHVFRGTW